MELLANPPDAEKDALLRDNPYAYIIDDELIEEGSSSSTSTLTEFMEVEETPPEIKREEIASILNDTFGMDLPSKKAEEEQSKKSKAPARRSHKPISTRPAAAIAADQEIQKKYEQLLLDAKSLDFSDLSALNIASVLSQKASKGRPIIVFDARNILFDKLPNDPKHQEIEFRRIMLYSMQLWDKVVRKRYIVIYVHHQNIPSKNRPAYQFFLEVRRSLPRKYRKNVHRFYIVQPTWHAKLLLSCLSPFLPARSWKKVHYGTSLEQVLSEITPKKNSNNNEESVLASVEEDDGEDGEEEEGLIHS